MVLTPGEACYCSCLIQLSTSPLPDTYVLEGALISDRIRQDNAVSALVVGLRDGSIPFLPSSIPNLKLQPGTVHIDRLNLEIDTDGSYVAGLELVLTEPNKNVALTHSTVANDDDLKQQILLWVLVGRH